MKTDGRENQMKHWDQVAKSSV